MAAPRRLLYIASIGNPPPYRTTRHSAGHLLLDSLLPLLRKEPRFAPFYETWYSTSYMNESGPKLVKRFQRWLETRDKRLDGPIGSGLGISPQNTTSTGLSTTLVLLHDELEAPPGKIRVKRGGPEAASLRGHRGLISTFQSLRGKGLYRDTADSSGQRSGRRDISVLRVGIGIGRPETREKDAVADYVLSEMSAAERAAVERAAGPVMGLLEREFSWEGSSSGGSGSKV